MWIFLNNAFLSIVEEPGKLDTLLVRARKRGDLERTFPGTPVEETPSRDYRFRARIDRERVAAALADAVRSIRYSNFKDSVPEYLRRSAYHSVWDVMLEYQRDAQS